MNITLYTDGSSRGNPGPGGWGCVLVTEHKLILNSEQSTEAQEYEDEVIELGGSEDRTTNNRMELRAAIMGLREVPSSQFQGSSGGAGQLKTGNLKLETVEICTDSEYVKKGMSEWINGWIAKGWKTSTKKPVLNQDLWEELHAEEKRLKDAGINIVWTYVRGHAGVPLNERADVIATSCADSVIEKGATNLQLYRGSKRDYPLVDSL